MLEFFIEATEKVIENEGVENVTARKIADLAGYTSSTIYNYFEELNHLIFFGSLRFLNDYIEDLSVYIEKENEPMEKYLSTWECFCKHSFNNPQIYNIIFIANLGSEPNELLKRYYKIYQNEVQSLYSSQSRQLEFMNHWVHQMKTPISVINLLLEEEDIDRESIKEEIERLHFGLDSVLVNARLETFERDMTIAVRCACPPDNSSGRLSKISPKPSRFDNSEIRCSISSRVAPSKVNGNTIFSSTVSIFNKLMFWKTKPNLFLRKRASLLSDSLSGSILSMITRP